MAFKSVAKANRFKNYIKLHINRLVDLEVDLDKIQTEIIFMAMLSWDIPVLPKKVPFELTGGNAKKIEKSKMAARTE